MRKGESFTFNLDEVVGGGLVRLIMYCLTATTIALLRENLNGRLHQSVQNEKMARKENKHFSGLQARAQRNL
tara:strand:- start:994 stop:1209 length:216 start_codon:yes stop_codon:yes gene_type:complete